MTDRRTAAVSGSHEATLLPMLLVGNGIVGGMEQYVLALLRAFRRRGQPALVAAPFTGDFTERLFAEGHSPQDFHCLPMSWEGVDPDALAELLDVIRTRRVDLLHSHLLPADTLGAVASAVAGIPLLTTLHGMLHTAQEARLRRICSAEYIAVSAAGHADALACGLPPETVRCVPNGLDTGAFDRANPNRDAVRRELEVGRDELLVLSVARLDPEKDPRGVLAVAEKAAARDGRLVFALAGTGIEEPEIRRLHAVHPAADRIRVLGLRHDVPALLAAADIFVLTSASESLPFAVMEAMAMRLPVVCYDVGGVREVVVDDEHGRLVRRGDVEAFVDRVLELASDPPLRRRLGDAGRRRIEAHHGFDRSAEGTLRAYRELASRRRDEGGRTRPQPRARETDLPGLHGARIVDSHVHLSGRESPDQVLSILDQAGIHAACLIGPFLDPQTWEPVTGAALAAANEFLLRTVDACPDRLWGLVTVDPHAPSAPAELEELAAAPGVRGVKLIPHGWDPGDSVALRVYEAAEALGLPILFHSGIFISGRVSDACRPARFEAVRRFPRLRVVLAHLGWPWTDEAIAVAYMDLLKGRPPQILLDTSPGTPPIYREDALRRALAVLGPDPLLWGCDRFLPADPGLIRGILEDDARTLHGLGLDRDGLRAIFGGNATALFHPRIDAT